MMGRDEGVRGRMVWVGRKAGGVGGRQARVKAMFSCATPCLTSENHRRVKSRIGCWSKNRTFVRVSEI